MDSSDVSQIYICILCGVILAVYGVVKLMPRGKHRRNRTQWDKIDEDRRVAVRVPTQGVGNLDLGKFITVVWLGIGIMLMVYGAGKLSEHFNPKPLPELPKSSSSQTPTTP